MKKSGQNEFVMFRHSADTKESEKQEREKEWSGGTESYFLTEIDGVTALTVKTDVPQEQEINEKHFLNSPRGVTSGYEVRPAAQGLRELRICEMQIRNYSLRTTKCYMTMIAGLPQNTMEYFRFNGNKKTIYQLAF